MSETFTLRLTAETKDELASSATRRGLAPRTLAQRFIEEGLRRERHPLLEFRDGPTGRRAGLVGAGLDAWEVIATLQDNGGDENAAADHLGIAVGLVEAVLAYYGEHTEEIDTEISANERDWERGYRAAEQGRQALRT